MSKSRLSRTSAIVAHTPEAFAINVERASLLLASCRDVPSARDMRDKAKAAAIYLRAKKAGLSAQNDAREVMLRAERRMAELLPAGDERAKGTRIKAGEKTPRPDTSRTTLADLGIDKDEAKRLRQHRAVDERVFEEHVRAVREAGEKLTLAKVAPPPTSSAAGYDGDESYTPIEIVEDARKVMGGIDCDPASPDNHLVQKRIGASQSFTKTMDGLLSMRRWRGRVWLNPPYSAGLIDRFVTKLLHELEEGHAEQAVVLVNASTETEWFGALARRSLLVCLLDSRTNFDQPDGKGGLRSTKSNRYAQAAFYFGEGARASKFRELFLARGLVGHLEGR